MHELTQLLRQLEASRFFGSVEVKFEAGHVVLLKLSSQRDRATATTEAPMSETNLVNETRVNTAGIADANRRLNGADVPVPGCDAPGAEAASTLNELLTQLEAQVKTHYPGLLPSVKCGLAVFGTMALAGRTRPLSLIYEATSGYGKSAVVEMFFPSGELNRYAYRCDKFTPKAFVSHAANKRKKELSEVDMLPKLQNKVLVTKELAPIFRGREEEVKENFATLIPVLDGKGFTSNSGTQGRRGYENPILFNWIGATTPLPRETYRIMYQLGTRLLFYEVPSVTPSEEELLNYAERDDTSQAEVDCGRIVNQFLVEFFKQHPVSSVAPGKVKMGKPLLRQIARWALLVARARSGARHEKIGRDWEAVAANHPEGPYKIVNYFKELARGYALIHGHKEVTQDDLEIIAHVALSSAPGYLRPSLRALRELESVTSADVRKLCGVSHPTARRYLEELEMLGIVSLEKGLPESNAPHTAKLSADFAWLCPLKAECGVSVGEEGEVTEIATEREV